MKGSAHLKMNWLILDKSKCWRRENIRYFRKFKTCDRTVLNFGGILKVSTKRIIHFFA